MLGRCFTFVFSLKLSHFVEKIVSRENVEKLLSHPAWWRHFSHEYFRLERNENEKIVFLSFGLLSFLRLSFYRRLMWCICSEHKSTKHCRMFAPKSKCTRLTSFNCYFDCFFSSALSLKCATLNRHKHKTS